VHLKQEACSILESTNSNYNYQKYIVSFKEKERIQNITAGGYETN